MKLNISAKVLKENVTELLEFLDIEMSAETDTHNISIKSANGQRVTNIEKYTMIIAKEYIDSWKLENFNVSDRNAVFMLARITREIFLYALDRCTQEWAQPFVMYMDKKKQENLVQQPQLLKQERTQDDIMREMMEQEIAKEKSKPLVQEYDIPANIDNTTTPTYEPANAEVIEQEKQVDMIIDGKEISTTVFKPKPVKGMGKMNLGRRVTGEKIAEGVVRDDSRKARPRPWFNWFNTIK